MSGVFSCGASVATSCSRDTVIVKMSLKIGCSSQQGTRCNDDGDEEHWKFSYERCIQPKTSPVLWFLISILKTVSSPRPQNVALDRCRMSPALTGPLTLLPGWLPSRSTRSTPNVAMIKIPLISIFSQRLSEFSGFFSL